jgi:hypothetical protein
MVWPPRISFRLWTVTVSVPGSQVTPKVVRAASPSGFSTLRTRRL